MKKNSIGFIYPIIFWFFIYPCSAQSNQGKNDFFLPENAYCEFGKPNGKYVIYGNSYVSRGSFDQTGFKLKTTLDGHLRLSKISACLLKHQNEIMLENAFADLWFSKDTLTINISSKFQKLYVCSLNEKGKVDSFPAQITIRTLMEDFEGKKARIFVKEQIRTLVAMPDQGDPEDLFQPIHQPQNVARFVWFEVDAGHGQKNQYKPGDFLIMGGNSLHIPRR